MWGSDSTANGFQVADSRSGQVHSFLRTTCRPRVSDFRCRVTTAHAPTGSLPYRMQRHNREQWRTNNPLQPNLFQLHVCDNYAVFLQPTKAPLSCAGIGKDRGKAWALSVQIKSWISASEHIRGWQSIKVWSRPSDLREEPGDNDLFSNKYLGLDFNH